MRKTALLIIYIFMVPQAQADICDFYKNNLLPMYQLLCSGEGKNNQLHTGSTFEESFSISPATLPTEPSPYGVEIIGNVIRDPFGEFQPQFGIIKGFKKIGMGISTSSNKVFYANDIVQRTQVGPTYSTFKNKEEAMGKITNLNGGTAFALIPGKPLIQVPLGVSLRYNYITNTIGGGPAIAARAKYFNLGVGVSRERTSNTLPFIFFLSGFVSVKLPIFEFEYTILKNAGGFPLDPIHIYTVTLSMGKLLMSGALRRLNFLSDGTVNQYHFSLQMLLSPNVSIGYLYNFIPGASSIAAQFYL